MGGKKQVTSKACEGRMGSLEGVGNPDAVAGGPERVEKPALLVISFDR